MKSSKKKKIKLKSVTLLHETKHYDRMIKITFVGGSTVHANNSYVSITHYALADMGFYSEAKHKEIDKITNRVVAKFKRWLSGGEV